jgi:hypothetical protein
LVDGADIAIIAADRSSRNAEAHVTNALDRADVPIITDAFTEGLE